MARPIAHGGGLIAARHQFRDAPEPWIDLSTGINPVAYPIPSLPPEVFIRLPEPEMVAGLEAIAAAAYGASDPAMVVAAPGTQSLIHLLPRLISARRVAVLGPTYAEHAAAWALAGCSVVTVAELAETDGADVVVVCNPNNPDGRRFAPAALAGVRGTLVVDEAFADLDGESIMAAAPPTPALPARGREKKEDGCLSSPSPLMVEGGVGVRRGTTIVLRSFGKTYGLAGVRLGFAIAAPGLAGRIREALGPWAVSGPALHIGALALADTAWRAAAVERLAADAARLDGLLMRAGCTVLGGTRLFRLIAHDHAGAMSDRLARAGILVRRFQDRPHWLRFGIPGAEAAWLRLGTALR